MCCNIFNFYQLPFTKQMNKTIQDFNAGKYKKKK